MANAEQVDELRRKISEPDPDTWTDQMLSDLIDAASGDINVVAGNLWEEKASIYAEMTDISEAGSSRKNSQLYKQALEMAAWYRTTGATVVPEPVAGVDYPTTTRIVRPV